MNLLGIHLTLLIGPTVPVPAPPLLTENLQSVQVTHNDEGRSGFQLTFGVARSGPGDLFDYRLLASPLVRPFVRVVLVVTFDATPSVLMDGIVTHQQLSPAGDSSGSFTLTGEDVSVMMDREEKVVEHPAQDDAAVATLIILGYPQLQLLPVVIPPPVLDPPLPTERTPVQYLTDLGHLQQMAERHSFVFYVDPGPLPLTNTAYWGPRVRTGIPQKALSVDLGAETNVESLSFQYDALAATVVSGQVQDRVTNQKLPVRTFSGSRSPLALLPDLPFNFPNVRSVVLRDSAGLNLVQAYAKAQATTDASVESVVTCQGTLDAIRYGGILRPRGLVGLRGAGFSYDGLYYVKSVTHTLANGSYKQNFVLTRDGLGSITPAVIP
jgi:hypothetical protein